MAARILDGNAIRDSVLAELASKVEQAARYGVRPGLAAVLVGEDPASKIYVPEQDPRLRPHRGALRDPAPARGDHDGGIGDRGRGAQQPRGDRRHPSPAAAAEPYRRPARARVHLPGERRRRIPSDQRGQAGKRAVLPGTVHAARPHRNPQAQPDPDQGTPCGRRRPQQHRGQAGRAAAAGRTCHSHHLPLTDSRPARSLPAGRYPSGRSRPAGHADAGSTSATGPWCSMSGSIACRMPLRYIACSRTTPGGLRDSTRPATPS